MLTVGLNSAVVLMATLAEVGVRETVIAGTVIMAACDLVASDAEVAVSMTLRSLAGAVIGALYVVLVPLAVMVGETLPQAAAGAEHLIVQVTPRLTESLLTVAANCIEVPAMTVAEGLDRLTVINEGVLEPPQPASKDTRKHPHAIQWARTLPFVHIANPLVETQQGFNGYQGL